MTQTCWCWIAETPTDTYAVTNADVAESVERDNQLELQIALWECGKDE